jgi:D-alanine-D-alanine ligase
MIDVGPTLYRDLQDQKIELAFLALHGPGGEDGVIQGFLESVGIPYTGSSLQANAVGMHKVTTKTILAAHRIPVPAGIVIKKGQQMSSAAAMRAAKLRWPVVVKPASQGSTIGVTIVRKPSQWSDALALAHRYDRDAMVEAYIPGHEVTVSVIGSGDDAPVVLPAVEIIAPNGFYDFAAKYEKGKTQYLCPAPLAASISKHIRELALQTYRVMDCNGAIRVDFRITSRGKPFVLEINTVPGMTETSLLPMAAKQAGMDYDDLTERILESALFRAKQQAAGSTS